MKKDIVDIVMEKEFIELTAEERSELSEFCSSEEEFNQIRQVFNGVEGMSFENPAPRPETKYRLDDLFEQAHPKAPVWYNSFLALLVPREKPFYRQPLLQAAAVLLLLFMTVPFVNNNMSGDSKNLMAENDVQTEDVLTSGDVTPAPMEEVTDVQEEDELNQAIEQEPEPPVLVADLNDPSSSVTSNERFESLAAAGATAPGSNHPDGIFTGISAENVAYSLPASESTDLLDLLTVTF